MRKFLMYTIITIAVLSIGFDIARAQNSQGSFSPWAIFRGSDVIPKQDAWKVGVGTSTPYEKLSVEGNAVVDGNVLSSYYTATSTTATSTFPNISTSQLSLGFAVGSIPFSSGYFLAESTNLNWDNTTLTLNALQFEGLQVITAKVNEASGITKGQAVYIDGATGNKPQVSLADNTLHNNAHTFGIANETKTNGQNILIAVGGEMIDVDTNSYTEGCRLHLATAGAMTCSIQKNGAHIHMGFVSKVNVSSGIIEVSPEIYTHELRATIDLDVTLATGDNTSTRKIIFENYDRGEIGWVNGSGQWMFGEATTTSLTSLFTISSTTEQNLFLVNDDGASDTSPFVITQDGNVGIATSSPYAKLSVSGDGVFANSSDEETLHINTSMRAVGINTQPTTANVGLDVLSALILMGGDDTGNPTRTNNANKEITMLVPNYTTDEFNVLGLQFTSAGARNRMSFGGGDSGTYKGLGRYDFYLADSQTTTDEAIVIRFEGNNGDGSYEANVNPNNENVNFRIEGDTDQNLLFTEASTNSVGIGTSSPSSKLSVDGTGYFDIGQSYFIVESETEPDIFNILDDGTDVAIGMGTPAVAGTRLTIDISAVGTKKGMQINSTGAGARGLFITANDTHPATTGTALLFVIDKTGSQDFTGEASALNGAVRYGMTNTSNSTGSMTPSTMSMTFNNTNAGTTPFISGQHTAYTANWLTFGGNTRLFDFNTPVSDYKSSGVSGDDGLDLSFEDFRHLDIRKSVAGQMDIEYGIKIEKLDNASASYEIFLDDAGGTYFRDSALSISSSVDGTLDFNADTNFVFNTGNVGIGTSSPYAELTVWGDGETISTTAFEVVNNASSTLFKVANDGSVTINSAYTLPKSDGSTDDIIKTDGSGNLAFAAPTSHTQISFSMYDAEPARGSETSLDGAFISLATAQPLNSVPTDIVVSKGTGKLVVVVNAGGDFAGDITVTGTSTDRDTGVATGLDTDTLTIDALTTDGSDTDINGNARHAFTGAYITSKWFTGTVTLSTTNLTLTDVDVYHVSFEQFDDTANITLDTFDANILTTNVNAEFDSYLYALMVTGDKCDITREASLNVGADGETAIVDRYWRLRRGNIGKAIDGTTDGTWVDVHYSNSPAYVEDVSIKVWATEIVPLTLN